MSITALIIPTVRSILANVELIADDHALSLDAATKTHLKAISNMLAANFPALREAEEEQIQHDQPISSSLRGLQEVVYDIDDLLDEAAYDTLQRRYAGKGKMLSQKIRYVFRSPKVSRKIGSLQKALAEIIAELENGGFVAKCPVEPPRAVSVSYEQAASTSVYETEVVGRDMAKEKIISRLLGSGTNSTFNSLSVLPIVGMYGIGKTVLAQLVYNDERIKEHFSYRLWTHVSFDFGIRKILGTIIKEAAGIDKTSDVPIEQLVDLVQQPLSGERYFLVLDDLEGKDVRWWASLRRILAVGVAGSVILITTRNRNVASATHTIEPYELEGLPHSVSWSLFKRLAFRKGEEKMCKNLSEIGLSIVEGCGRHPIAVKLCAYLLCGRSKRVWNRFKKSISTDLGETNWDIRQFLKICVDSLPSHLKLCLAYLSISPRSLSYNATYQIYCWHALGLLKVDENGDIESCGQSYVMELLSGCILQEPVCFLNGKIKSFKINIIFLKLATQLLGKDCTVLTNSTKMYNSEDFRHIVCYDIADISAGSQEVKTLRLQLIKAEKARSFSFDSEENCVRMSSLEEIICNLRCLHILDLSFCDFEELPSSIGNLKHLRVLNMSFNPHLKSLPKEICNLLNLEALFLEGCKLLQSLPVRLYKLVNLKCIFVTTLQTSLFATGFDNPPSLKHLNFLSCYELQYLWEDIHDLTWLRRLYLHDCPKLTHLPSSLHLCRLQELVIVNCQKLDLKRGEGLHGLHSLQVLQITGVPLLTQLPPSLESSASSLEYLFLDECPGLIDLPDWLRSFVCLEKFFIHSCPALLALPDGFRYLTSLKELCIKNCPELSQRCAVTGEDFPLIKHIPHISIGRCFTQEDQEMEQEHTASVKEKAFRKSEITELGAQGIFSSASSMDMSSKSHTVTDGAVENNKWNILALVLKAKFKLTVAYKTRQKMKLHCCLFPDDYEFEKETFIQLCMAAGYLTTGNMEDTGNKCFDILLKEEYFLSTSDVVLTGRCKFRVNLNHVDSDIISAMKFKDIYTILRDDDDDDNKECDWEKSRHVSIASKLISNRTFESMKRFRQLRTLLLVRNYGYLLQKVPSDMFLTLHSLETLDLSGSHITELPGSIGNVRRMRYLNLSFTLIERLPEAIGHLRELQTLKLAGCRQLYSLPMGMKELINMRHLYFDVLGQLSSMPRGIGSLIELRTLSAFIVDAGGGEGSNIGELRSLRNLKGSCCISGLETISDGDIREPVLQNKSRLTRLQLRWNEYVASDKEHVSSSVSYLEPHPCIEELKLVCFPSSTLPMWISIEKFERLTSITFLKCQNGNFDICLGQLPNLQCLEMIQMNRVEQIDRSIHTKQCHRSFPKLKKLIIEGMDKLKSWTDIESGDFPLLSELSLKHCPNLSELHFFPYIDSLQHLEISNCPMLDSLFVEEQLDTNEILPADYDECLLNSESQSSDKLLSNLKTLMVDDCPLLKKWYSKEGLEWQKIKHVPNIWFDLEDMHIIPSDDTASGSDFSDDSGEYSDTGEEAENT